MSRKSGRIRTMMPRWLRSRPRPSDVPKPESSPDTHPVFRGGISMAHQVKFKGSPKNLAGAEVKVGAMAPEFACVTQGLEVVTLATTAKKARLFSAVPSLDTPVCSLETKKFD